MSDLFFGEFSTDLTPPEVTNASPTGVDALKTAPVEFDIDDTETGVDTSSIVVVIDSITAFSGGSVQNGFTGGLSGPVGSVYSMSLTPPADWDSYVTIPVTVDAQDLAPTPNVMSQYSWSFDVEDYEAPYVDAGWTPTGVGVPTTAVVTFALKDDGTGVDLSSVIVTVGGVIAFSDGVFQSGFQGGASALDDSLAPQVYGFIIDASPDYDEWTTYEVIVNARDLAFVYADFDGGGAFFETFEDWGSR